MALPISVEYVRKYLRDYPQKNFKYNKKFFEDTEIETAIMDAAERGSQIPPISSTGTTIPNYLLRYGVIGILFESRYINMAVNYNPGIYENGLQEPVGAEAQLFQNLASHFNNQFTTGVTQFKVAFNMEATITLDGPDGANNGAVRSWYHDNGKRGGSGGSFR